jgi:hypothetical protein
MSASFQEVIVTYCLRVLEQTKLKISEKETISQQSREMSIIQQSLVEVIRILDLLCLCDYNLVFYLFHLVLFTFFYSPFFFYFGFVVLF